VTGSAFGVWNGVVDAVSRRFQSVEQEWKDSKSEFGRICLLKQKKRTLLYLTPQKESVLAAVVLGERAVELALASKIPDEIKTLIREARPYAEGRGIRFPINDAAGVEVVTELVAIKLTPK
jgi:dihydrodipicolinate synthase/N-acetylneuraminate lyase